MKSNFKELLSELESLSRQGVLSVHRRAEIIVALVRDRDGWQHVNAEDEGQVRAKLQAYIKEIGFTVDELITMIDYEPSVEAWQTKRLRDILDEAYANRARRSGATQRHREPVPVVEQLRAKVAEANHVIADLKQSGGTLGESLKRQLAEANELIASLKRQVADLKKENGHLKRRLKKIETSLVS